MNLEDKRHFRRVASLIASEPTLVEEFKVAVREAAAVGPTNDLYGGSYLKIMEFVIEFQNSPKIVADRYTKPSAAISEQIRSMGVYSGVVRGQKVWMPPYLAWLSWYHREKIDQMWQYWSTVLNQRLPDLRRVRPLIRVHDEKHLNHIIQARQCPDQYYDFNPLQMELDAFEEHDSINIIGNVGHPRAAEFIEILNSDFDINLERCSTKNIVNKISKQTINEFTIFIIYPNKNNDLSQIKVALDLREKHSKLQFNFLILILGEDTKLFRGIFGKLFSVSVFCSSHEYRVIKSRLTRFLILKNISSGSEADFNNSLQNREQGRIYLEDEFQKDCFQCGNEKVIGLVLFDIDRMNSINRMYGEAVGDDVLSRIEAMLPEFALGFIDCDHMKCGRCGDDTFFMAILGVNTPSKEQDVMRIAEEVLRWLGALKWEEISANLWVSCSVGYAVKKSSEESLDTVARAALGMIQSQKNGGSRSTEGPAYLSPGEYTDTLKLFS